MVAEKDYQVNPLANIFPAMAQAELEELAVDIETNGLQEPAQLDAEGRILDGRNRHAACWLAMRIKVFRVKKWKGRGSPEAYARFIIQRNILRRHLTAAQRAQLIVKVPEAAKRGRPQTPKINSENVDDGIPKTDRGDKNYYPTASELASAAGVSKASVRKARRVRAKGEEAESAVLSGDKTPEQVLAPDPKPAPEPEPKTDPYGNEIVDDVALSWDDAHHIKQYLTQLHALKRKILTACEQRDPGWCHVIPHRQRIETEFRNIAAALRFGLPHCLCGYCGGDGCNSCHDSGWLPKEVYDRLPSERKWKEARP